MRSARDIPTLARTMGLLYLAGATIGLLSLWLPHSAAANDGALYSNIALAYVTGAGVLALGRRVRPWMLHTLLIAGVLVIARAIYYSGEHVSFYSTWFIWIGLVTFSFMRRGVAAAYLAYTSAVYALTLVNEPSTSPVARWLTTVTTLVVAGVIINVLVERARRQAELADSSAQRVARVAEVAHELARVTDVVAARATLHDAAARLTGASALRLLEAEESTADADALRAFFTGRTVTAGERLLEPVVLDAAPIAVLAFSWPTDDECAAAPTDVISLLAATTAVTLERLALLRRLEASARTDELTGLPNRRAWQEEMPRELARARREGTPLCVAIFDLDHFKAYNDEHGHIAGDVLLKEAAAAWAVRLRPTDLLARYGGEEFTLAMPRCDEAEAAELVERLRLAMPGGRTCSAGIACWDGVEPAETLLERADRALYRAKELGRDQGHLASA